MFSLFSRKTQKPAIDLSAIGIDIHSHLLPGIDDGSPDIETSLHLINGLQALGLHQCITTPHILWDLYKNTASTIEPALSSLQNALQHANSTATLHGAAAEYMIDDYFASLLRKKEPLRTIRTNHVLVEFSFVNLPFDWKQIFFDLQVQGYQPILAHPERYAFLFNQWNLIQDMLDMGILFQVNLNALTGYYGKPILQQAQQLIKRNMVAFLGTDLHHQRHLDALKQSTTLMPLVQETVSKSTWRGFYN